MKNVKCDKFVGIFSKIGKFLVGLCATSLVLPVFLLLVSPFFLYWFIVFKICVPLFGKDNNIVKPAQEDGSSLEFVKSKQHIHPRLSLVVTLVLEGTIPKSELINLVQTKWIDAKNEEGKLRHPELRQYIEEWMGFMFWKEEESFNLGNHFYYFHNIDEYATDTDSRGFVDTVVESLINKPYRPRWSPWEIHVIYNYKDKELQKRSKEKKMTVLLFRCHHAMAMASHGDRILKMFVESLFDRSLGSCNIPRSFMSFHEDNKRGKMRRILDVIKNTFQFPVKVFHEMGCVISPIFWWKDPWHVGDGRKDWMQLYARSPMIPFEKIKLIENCFQTTTEGVIITCVSGAIGNAFSAKGYHRKELEMGLIVHERGECEPRKGKRSMTTMALSIEPTLSSRDRLQATDRNMASAKRSLVPLLSRCWSRLISFQISRLAHHLFQNRTLSTFYVHLPGPGAELTCMNSKRLLAANFASGGPMGCSGVCFQVFTYNDHVHISATAESKVMNRAELEDLVHDISLGIDKLHVVAMNCANGITETKHYGLV